LRGSLGAVIVIDTTGVAVLKIYPIVIGLGTVVSIRPPADKVVKMRVLAS
jgi:hypothetical protein